MQNNWRYGGSGELFPGLTERGVPFLMYSGYPTLDDACKGAPRLKKPASHEQMLDAVEALIRGAKGSN